jgi:16S rRNA (cytosine1402-N4)-methyltransferase
LANAERLQRRFVSRLSCWEMNFADAATRFSATATPKLDGVLLDLGVSSHQLDTPDRGFSFQRPGPLDMRMGPNVGPSAAELLNTASEAELTRILRQYGEEPAARRIAAQIVRTRETRPFVSTSDLSETVERVVHRRGPRHPATRVFQALRIAVNRELAALEEALPALAGWLKPGGRLVVIAFHSLEDRIVKLFFREVSREWLDRPEWPEPRRNPAHGFRLLTPRPIEPSEREQRENPRARSAKLRAIEKL